MFDTNGQKAELETSTSPEEMLKGFLLGLEQPVGEKIKAIDEAPEPAAEKLEAPGPSPEEIEEMRKGFLKDLQEADDEELGREEEVKEVMGREETEDEDEIDEGLASPDSSPERTERKKPGLIYLLDFEKVMTAEVASLAFPFCKSITRRKATDYCLEDFDEERFNEFCLFLKKSSQEGPVDIEELLKKFPSLIRLAAGTSEIFSDVVARAKTGDYEIKTEHVESSALKMCEGDERLADELRQGLRMHGELVSSFMDKAAWQTDDNRKPAKWQTRPDLETRIRRLVAIVSKLEYRDDRFERLFTERGNRKTSLASLLSTCYFDNESFWRNGQKVQYKLGWSPEEDPVFGCMFVGNGRSVFDVGKGWRSRIKKLDCVETNIFTWTKCPLLAEIRSGRGDKLSDEKRALAKKAVELMFPKKDDLADFACTIYHALRYPERPYGVRIFYGEGRNGKSAMIDAIMRVFGEEEGYGRYLRLGDMGRFNVGLLDKLAIVSGEADPDIWEHKYTVIKDYTSGAAKGGAEKKNGGDAKGMKAATWWVASNRLSVFRLPKGESDRRYFFHWFAPIPTGVLEGILDEMEDNDYEKRGKAGVMIVRYLYEEVKRKRIVPPDGWKWDVPRDNECRLRWLGRQLKGKGSQAEALAESMESTTNDFLKDLMVEHASQVKNGSLRIPHQLFRYQLYARAKEIGSRVLEDLVRNQYYKRSLEVTDFDAVSVSQKDCQLNKSDQDYWSKWVEDLGEPMPVPKDFDTSKPFSLKVSAVTNCVILTRKAED